MKHSNRMGYFSLIQSHRIDSLREIHSYGAVANKFGGMGNMSLEANFFAWNFLLGSQAIKNNAAALLLMVYFLLSQCC